MRLKNLCEKNITVKSDSVASKIAIFVYYTVCGNLNLCRGLLLVLISDEDMHVSVV